MHRLAITSKGQLEKPHFFSENNWHVLLMMYIDQAHEQTFKLQCNFSLICL